jgi:phosphoglycerate dehydrogenase-like enzyme
MHTPLASLCRTNTRAAQRARMTLAAGHRRNLSGQSHPGFNVRSSTVFGVVGAGGIGQELKNRTDLCYRHLG